MKSNLKEISRALRIIDSSHGETELRAYDGHLRTGNVPQLDGYSHGVLMSLDWTFVKMDDREYSYYFLEVD